MATFVLVHGAWMDASGWEKVTPLLQAEGHAVITPDLPGHGADATPVGSVSLQSYVDRVRETVEQQAEPVVLVGHSMAGTVISGVAEARPERVRALVYLSAYLLPDGDSLFAASTRDTASQLGPFLRPDQEQGVIAVTPEGLQKVFYHDCTEEDAWAGIARTQPEPLAPLATPVRVSAQRFGRVPRVYVQTLNDRVVSPALQQQMIAALPCRQVLPMAWGHLAFVAAPAEVARTLLQATG
jgi:pimeloyl-ACP methyl ester carboxylesterase